MESTTPHVLLLSRDAPTRELLTRLAEAQGARVQCPETAAVLAGSWVLVCVDEALGIPLAQLTAVGAAPVLWLSAQPRGDGAARALAAGVADMLALPLWEPEARARLARWLPAAKPPPGAGAGELHRLLEVQRELIPLQVPSEIEARVHAGLQRLFPGAAVEIRREPGEGVPVAARVPGDGSWATATVALAAGGDVQGTVRVTAADGIRYPAAQRDLLEVYAAQAAAGLHRSRLYAALSMGKADWEQTFDAIPDCIAILGPDHVIRRVNRALARSAGLTPQELVGRPCHQVLHERSTPCESCPVAEVFHRGCSLRWPQELRRNDILYDYQAFPLRDAQGAVRAVITYGRDVTRVEQLEQGLRHSDKLMTLGQIAAGIAHEINNPLTAISSYAQLLALQTAGSNGAESARRIQNGIERIHRLVQNLTSFSHPADATFYPLDLNEVVRKTLSFSSYEVTRGETRLEQQLQPGLPKVLGSEPQLEQLLVNLLTNARDAVGGRGTVEVSTAVVGDQVQLTVSDDGVGFPAAVADQLFEPFYTTKPVGKGTGLGLFIAAGIAAKHRGRLQLESQPGQGTAACLTLPIFS